MSADAATSVWLAAGTALGLGFLTSISPCPLATNVAAMSCLARQSGSVRGQLLAGLAYAGGRAVAYLAVGGVLAFGLLQAPALSSFLQHHMDQLLGPLLLLIGMVLLGLLPGLPSFGGVQHATQQRLAAKGLLGSALLGFLFALAFCPVSAALFFGSLLPLSVQQSSWFLLPSLFGLGSATPVLAFAVLLLLGRGLASRWFARTQQIDRWLLPATGWLLVGLGVFLCLTRTLGLF